MINYQGTDKTIENIHNKLNRIEWILKNKRPYPTNSDPANNWLEQFMNEMKKGGNNPFGGYQW